MRTFLHGRPPAMYTFARWRGALPTMYTFRYGYPRTVYTSRRAVYTFQHKKTLAVYTISQKVRTARGFC